MLSARAFRGRLTEEVERARRYQRSLSLAVIGLDDFAAHELRHGFRAGDELLVAAAARIGAATRSHDLLGRTGDGRVRAAAARNRAPRQCCPMLERLLMEFEVAGGGSDRGAAGASIGRRRRWSAG